ncbi:MAG: NAD-dependent epimerase/dehydratase family protein [Cyclobacteriaceae bacterium]|nr:NAD-dependent epimerase/dehydratase family protein [Cyclobacteriaceae bacterium]
MSNNKTALIAGATGLVGNELVRLLLGDSYYDKVVVIGRRSLLIDNERLQEIILDDFDKLDQYNDLFNVHHVFCCLGTTQKKAGSKELFRKIDLEYPVKMAELAKDKPLFQSYHVVTAVGACSDSALYYNQVKGELEDALKGMGLKSLKIYQPSLLLGKREDFRLLEEVAKAISSVLSFFVIGSRRGRIWSIHGHDVAKSMVLVAKQEQHGLEVFEPKHMIHLVHDL